VNVKINVRLAGLGLALGLLGTLIIVVTLTSQQHAEEARARLGQVDMESMRISDRFKEKQRYANDQMRRYASSRDPAHWQEFLKASEELKGWIDSQPSQLTPGLEQEVLKQMAAAYAVYMRKAQDLHDRMETTGEATASLVEYNGFFDQSRHLHDLADEPDSDAAPAVRARSGGITVPVRTGAGGQSVSGHHCSVAC
jgi:nitrate/nitrite-specific signal transduction histidine kinase